MRNKEKELQLAGAGEIPHFMDNITTGIQTQVARYSFNAK